MMVIFAGFFHFKRPFPEKFYFYLNQPIARVFAQSSNMSNKPAWILYLLTSLHTPKHILLRKQSY